MRSPCKGCGRRREGCHAECESYRSFRESVKTQREQERRERVLNDFALDHAARAARIKQKYQK